MKAVLILTLVVAFSTFMFFNQQPMQSDDTKFTDFVTEFRKSYFSASEYELRKTIFMDNVNTIESLNADSSESASYTINAFADMTFEEFSKSYLGTTAPKNRKTESYPVRDRVIPDTVDW